MGAKAVGIHPVWEYISGWDAQKNGFMVTEAGFDRSRGSLDLAPLLQHLRRDPEPPPKSLIF